jgi:hypothetical protein
MRIRLHYGLVLLLALPLCAETIDRIVATVNGRPVMESELAEQLHVEQLLAGRPPALLTIAEQRLGLERLLDQILLQQQMDAVNFEQPSAEDVGKRVQQVQQQVVPNAGKDAWQRSLASYGLTEADLAEHVAMELRTLRFIDARFRPAIRVDPGTVEAYYRDELVPKMKQAGATPPALKQVESRIREILVQKQMDDLLESWLKSLRFQTEIRLPAPSSSVEAAQPANAQAAEAR